MIINTKAKRVFLYVRVSTAEQVKEGYSIDEQIERLRKYCEAHGWIIVKIYTDAGYSGGNTERPALQEMIEAIEKGQADSVLVYKLDRLSRSQKDTLMLIEDVFLANNCDFVSMNENFDTSTPFGRAMIGILAVFAQLEREQIKERMAMGREGRAKEGKYHGGHFEPIGYKYIDGELVIDEFEAMQVKEIFNLYNKGVSTRNIERSFLEKGYKHKHGKWSDARIKYALKNKLYIGFVEFDHEYYEGIHTPIVTAKEFETAANIMEIRRAQYGNNGSGKRKTTYLGGLIFCKRCTARYSGYNNNGYKYYGCHSRRKSKLALVKDPNCKNKNYRMSDLDNMVFDEIRKLAVDPNYFEQLKSDSISQEDIDKERVIKNQIAKIDDQKSRFMDLYGLGEFTIDELQKKTQPLNQQKADLEKELKALSKNKSNISDNQVLTLVSNFGDILDRGDFDEIRLTIETLIHHIDIDGENIYIKWNFA